MILSAALSRIVLFPLSHHDFTKTRKKTKTYHRFLGMFFFGGVKPTQVASHKVLATEKISKNRKSVC